MKTTLVLPSLALFLFACGSDDGVKAYNTDPSADITSHEEGAELLEGYDITFRGSVSDANHQNTELSVTWLTDLRELCPAQAPVADGSTTCIAKVEEGESQIKLQVVDPEGAAYVETINVNVQLTEAPTAQIVSPNASDAYYSDQLILFSAIINDAEDDPADLTYTWTSNQDGELPITITPETSGEIEQYINLTQGQHAITLMVEDTSGKTTNETVAITVGGPNNDPSCAITEPVADSVYVEGQSVAFAGTATDDDINNSLLSVSWESNIDGVFDTSSPFTDGTLGFSTSALRAGDHTISLKVEDEVGAVCSVGTQITIGTPPSLLLNSPSDGDVIGLSESIAFSATVSDQEDIASDISLSWYSDIDGEFSTQGSDSSGNISFSTSALTAGLHNIQVTATDTTGLTATTSFALRVNTAPPAPSISIDPDPAFTVDALNVIVTEVADADGDSITYSYEWFENGVATSYTSTTIPSSETASGEIWMVRVTPNDTHTDGDYAEASVTISNSVPSVDTVSTSPSSAYNDTTLTCSATTSDDDEVLTPSYEWSVGTSTYTGAILDLSTTAAMPTDVITCTASVEDNGGQMASSSTTITLDNRAPTVTGTSIAPSNVFTASTVTCSASVSDDDGENLTATYEWFVGSNGIGSGASLTLDPSLVSVGDSLTCTATAEDGYGGTHSEDASVVILNTDPTLDSVSIDISTPVASDTLTCMATGSDMDGDTPTYSFSWSNLITGDVYPSTTISTDSATLDLSTTTVSVDDEVECVVVASDADGGNDSDVAVVTIYNSGPEFDVEASIDINPNVYVGDVVTCSASTSDLNDGSITPTYEWSVNGTVIASGASYTVDATHTDVGDSLVCTATATDSDQESATSTASVTVENTAPTVSNVQVTSSSGNHYNDDTLTCSADVEDVDENINNTDYIWMLGSAQLGTGTTLDLSTVTVMPDDEVVCKVQTIDNNYEAAEATGSVTIVNRTPTVTGTAITGGTYNTDTLTCSATGSDPDESVVVEYKWTIDSIEIGTGSSIDLATTNAIPTDEVVCTALVEDSNGGSASDTGTLTLLNRVPSTPMVAISPTIPTTGVDDLVCNITTASTDADGQTVSYTYEWTTDGASTSYTTDTIPAADVGASETWMCTVTPDDGMDVGTSASDFVFTTTYCGSVDCDTDLDLGSGVDIHLVMVTAGSSFLMGSPITELGRDSNETQHEVTLTNDYYIMDTEVTQAMFVQLMGYESYDGKNTSEANGSYGIGANYPAIYASWHMSADFANAVTQRHNAVNGTSLQECYSCSGSGTTVSCVETMTPYVCSGYRLLTEAEWEYAARAGTTTAFWTPNGGAELPSGYTGTTSTLSDNSELTSYAWYYRTRHAPFGAKEVASLIPNDYGLYDMSGNVYEWVHDYNGPDQYNSDAITDPVLSRVDDARIIRSGYWANYPARVRSARRSGASAFARTFKYGFRLGMTVQNSKASAPEISISPASPTEAVDDIVCAIDTDSVDPNGDSITYSFSWTVDGVDYTGTTSTTTESGDTIDASETAAGEVWKCIVTPNDGTEDGYTDTASVTITSACVLTDCDSSLDLGGGQGIDFVNIEAGTFMMGSPSSEVGRYSNEEQHSVTLTNDFLVSTTEITQGMYHQLMGYQAYDGQSTSNSNGSFGVGDDYPAYYVSWNMAADFSNQLTQQYNSENGTSLTDCYSCTSSGSTSVSCSTAVTPIYSCTGYRLLTEAEWEYAARAGSTAAVWTPNGGGNIPSGYEYSGGCNLNWTLSDGTTLGDLVWFCGNYTYYNSSYAYGSKEVATKIPNDNGLYDMSGNIWEWTHDTYTGSLGTGATTDPVREIDSDRVVRNADWSGNPYTLRSARRSNYLPTVRNAYFGFRVGRTAP